MRPQDGTGCELRVVIRPIVHHRVIEDRESIDQFRHSVVSFTDTVDIVVLEEFDSGCIVSRSSLTRLELIYKTLSYKAMKLA